MANLRINGRSVASEGHALFGDFINSLTRDLATKSEVISMIKVDGAVLDEGQESSLAMRSLGQMSDVEVTTVNELELAFDALATAKKYIRRLSDLSRAAGGLYKNNGDRLTAEKTFLDLVEGLENLSNLLVSAQQVLRGRFRGVHTNDSSLRIAQIRLVSAIEELLPAKKKGDKVMLADILCNELPGALQEMADYGIPVLQRLKTS
ncbi:MAG: hypothetical protein HUU37_01705 [Bdellovibrionales bacterium]|nr:hypothetical protein [Bdellovibrionales bacterium]